ncbi:hypothetical protein EI555_003489 [Monodon monoceros]|uniref:Uncharacterized protein n=1 Tax=Monodon monoceros TaxID=40151 RepID=A0A4U1ELA0_MONMO|nr:hypothetical protein EI555_003489 [Monodon monoceros]
MARGDAPQDRRVGDRMGCYFQGRLAGANGTTETLGTNHTSPADTFNFNNWVTLLSQLPLLLFTLLNSFLYQW